MCEGDSTEIQSCNMQPCPGRCPPVSKFFWWIADTCILRVSKLDVVKNMVFQHWLELVRAIACFSRLIFFETLVVFLFALLRLRERPRL